MEIIVILLQKLLQPNMQSLAIKVRLYVIKITREHLIWEQYLSIKLEPICHYTEWYHKNWWFIFLHWKMSSTYYINVRLAKLYFDFYRISYLSSDFCREGWNLIMCTHTLYRVERAINEILGFEVSLFMMHSIISLSFIRLSNFVCKIVIIELQKWTCNSIFLSFVYVYK